MDLTDIFNSDAFSTVEMTAAIQELPYVPGRIGSMGLFDKIPITNTFYAIESEAGELRLIPDAPRGVHNRVLSTPARKMRSFAIPHFPLDASVKADDVMRLRSFGTSDVQPAVQVLVNNKMQRCRQNHEMTHEYMRVGAIQGVIKNAQGATITNLFTEFGVTEVVVSFNFNAAINVIKGKVLDVITSIESTLGGLGYERIIAVCGTTAYRNLVASAALSESFTSIDERWPIELQRAGITFAEIDWFPYRGKVGATPFVPDNQIRFFPVGVGDLFQQVIAPADFIEAVGSPGEEVYAKQELQRFGKGVDIHTQSNVHMVCTRPKVLVKGTDDTV